MDRQTQNGIIVGADLTQEWLLPWWWKNYRKHNDHPVVFFDFGLSLTAKKWCQKKGRLSRLQLLDDFVQKRPQIDAALAQKWDDTYGKAFWDSRAAWFKKPFACLKTPFPRTVWIDLDCEIKGPLDPLFSLAEPQPGIAMAQEQCIMNSTYPTYNSGVISFSKDSPLLVAWAEQCTHQTAQFRSDEDVFSSLLHHKKETIQEIPPIYNWSRFQKDPTPAIILHWHGTHGKEWLRMHIHHQSLKELSC